MARGSLPRERERVPSLRFTTGADGFGRYFIDDRRVSSREWHAANKRWIEAWNATWESRPRSFLQRVARLREEILALCERSGATVWRTAEELAALDAALHQTEGAIRYRGCGLAWPEADVKPHVREARADVGRALSNLGSAEAEWRHGEEGVATQSYERAARHYQLALTRRLESLARRGAKVDPKRATRGRRRQAERTNNERRRENLHYARLVLRHFERSGETLTPKALYAAMREGRNGPPGAMRDAYESACEHARKDKLRLAELERDLPKSLLEREGFGFA